MRSVNKVFLIGNVGRDPEVKATPNGTNVATFSLATSFKPKDKPEVTEWHNLVAFGQDADTVQAYVKKGSKLYIEGKLQTRSWDDKSTGKKQYRTEIVANLINLLDPPSGGNSGARPATTQDPITDDDIPF